MSDSDEETVARREMQIAGVESVLIVADALPFCLAVSIGEHTVYRICFHTLCRQDMLFDDKCQRLKRVSTVRAQCHIDALNACKSDSGNGERECVVFLPTGNWRMGISIIHLVAACSSEYRQYCE